jgi:hypothetical protein
MEHGSCGKIVVKLPSQDRLLWHLFENVQLGYIEDWPLKFNRFMVSSECAIKSTVVSGRSGYHYGGGALHAAAGSAPLALDMAATTVAN